MIGRLFAPRDIASLAAFRILFGGLMFWEVLRYFLNGWIHRYYISPDIFFTYPGFGWVSPWPGIGMYVHFAIMGAAAAGIALGFVYRISSILFFVTYSYAFLLDESRYNNHYYLICLIALILAFTPAHGAWSIDARLFPRIRRTTTPAWTIYLLRFQLAVVYFYAGLAKLDPDWLRGQPVALWLAARRDDAPLLGPWLDEPWMVYFVAWGGCAFDLLIVPFLLWRRTRLWAFIVAVFFHAYNKLLFDIGVFPFLATAATTIFFDPSWPRLLWSRVLRSPGARAPGGTDTLATLDKASGYPVPAPPSTRRAFILVALGLYGAFQLLFPLRHWLYEGNPSWTEEGHRFAWRMKLRDKEVGEAKIFVANPRTRAVERLDLNEWLVPHQAEALARPHMVLQLAHKIAWHYREERGWEQVEVRCVIPAILNDYEPQLLVHPWRDLAAERWSLGHADWIVPLGADWRTYVEEDSAAGR